MAFHCRRAYHRTNLSSIRRTRCQGRRMDTACPSPAMSASQAGAIETASPRPPSWGSDRGMTGRSFLFPVPALPLVSERASRVRVELICLTGVGSMKPPGKTAVSLHSTEPGNKPLCRPTGTFRIVLSTFNWPSLVAKGSLASSLLRRVRILSTKNIVIVQHPRPATVRPSCPTTTIRHRRHRRSRR